MQELQRQVIDASKLPQQLTAKWSASILAEGFVPFPKKLLRSMHRIFSDENSVKQLAVVLAIVDYKRPNLKSPPSLRYLAFLAGLDEVEFQAILSRLEEKGILKSRGDKDALDISLEGLAHAVERETS